MDLVSLGSAVEEEDSPLAFLEKVHLLRERVEELTSTPLPSLINLSVTPRAADFLQQHWPAVTIGSLEEAPVPKVGCCARCGRVGADADTKAEVERPDGWVQELWPTSSVVLLGLLLLAVVMWVNPVGGASLGFSLASRCSQLVHGLSSELIASLWDTAGSAYTVMAAALERWRSHLFSLSETVFQQLTVLIKT